MDICNKPCAATGLYSYRYKGHYGWIMIGAHSDGDALCQASRSISYKPLPCNLEKYNYTTKKYERIES